MGQRPLIVGVGHPDRGDDAVGLLVADAVRAAQPDADVVCLFDPLELVDAVAGRDVVVVVDASVTGGPVGSVLAIDATHVPLRESRGTAATSSHGFSVGDAIELARGLHALPARLVVVIVEIGRVRLGDPAQPDVLGAVHQAAATVLDQIGTRDASLR